MLKEMVRAVAPGSSLGYRLPDLEFLWQMYEATKFTPDIAKLEKYAWQLIFVTDQLKEGHLHNAKLGPEASYRFPAFTQQGFHYWDTPIPFLPPVPMKVEYTINPVKGFPPIAKIKGEVHLIRPQQFMTLDRYKQNTVEYQRERIKLVVPYTPVKLLKDHNLDPRFGVQEVFCRSDYKGSSVALDRETTCTIRAWMYTGKPDFWDPLINAFDYKAVETFHSKNRRWCQEYYNLRRPTLPLK